jgi:hypothetical protein
MTERKAKAEADLCGMTEREADFCVNDGSYSEELEVIARSDA